jgi:hypothetical protein
MKACLLFKTWCVGLLLAPHYSSGQHDYHPAAYTYNDAGSTITCNVPLNEINPHAWRHFHRLFPGAQGGEYWFASAEGYQVSFYLNSYHYQAYFDQRGAYRYSLHYYMGSEIPRDPGEMICRKFPDYRIDVVTEVTDGEKTIYLVKMVNASSIRTLSVCDGKMDIIEELTNGGPMPSPPTALISKRSDP